MQKIKINGMEALMFEFGVDINGRDFIKCEDLRAAFPEVVKEHPHVYMLRHGELDWTEPVTIENFVYANRLGFVALKKPVEFPIDGDKYVDVKSFERSED
jgi:hypothetical protein